MVPGFFTSRAIDYRIYVTAPLFENVPGGELEMLAEINYDEDPAAFEKTPTADTSSPRARHGMT